jgi:hypothetical protein
MTMQNTDVMTIERTLGAHVQIPRSSRPLFRDEAGRDSDMMPATIPR